jgi:hypothetical protein
MYKLIKAEGGKFTSEEASTLTIDEVKKMIETQDPKAFAKKATSKKSVTKKVVVKSAASKKAAPKKLATKKD